MINRNQKASVASKRYGLYQAKASGDLSAYNAIEAAWFARWGIAQDFLPLMAQFDESHKRWLENGREC